MIVMVEVKIEFKECRVTDLMREWRESQKKDR